MAVDDLDLGRTIRGFAAGEKLFARYTLKSILGRGGMGIVWRAFDEHLERDVALKFLPELIVLDHSALDELKRETKRNLELTHHNIVRIYDFAHEEQTACISMEYVDGQTLSALRVARQERVFEVEELEPLIVQVCQALDYAHAQAKIVHRDLKPSNLMLNSRGQLKITDFGIARSLSDSVSMLSMRATSGTLLYMSPQQLDGDRPSALDDIYSLGATLYELLTSKAPFFSGAIENQVRHKRAPSLAARRGELNVGSTAAIPDHWEKTIADCLAKDPAQRPGSAREVAERLGLPFHVTASAGRALSSATSERPPAVPQPSAQPADIGPNLRPSFALPPVFSKHKRAVGIGLAGAAACTLLGAGLWASSPQWYPELFHRKPSADWARKVAADRLPGEFAQGESLRFESKEVATTREAAGLANVTVNGAATLQAPLYESVSPEDPALGLEAKFAEMRSAQERARFLRERAGVDLRAIDAGSFHFVREKTPAGQTVPFRFAFQARRHGTDWRVDRVTAAELAAATEFAGKPLSSFPNAAILGSEKANRDKARFAQVIDAYVADVARGGELAVKRFAARGLDREGNPLFPPGRAMPGERFPETRSAPLQPQQLESWSDENLQYAINEVFARHGAEFRDKKISAAFAKFSWYRPNPDLSSNQVEELFSDIEAQNVRALAGARLAKQEQAAQVQRAAAAERERQAAQRQQQANTRARQEAQAQAERDEAARAIMGGVINAIINRAGRR